MSQNLFSRPTPYLCLLGIVAAIAVPLVLLEPETMAQESDGRPVRSDPGLASIEQRLSALERELALLALRLHEDDSAAHPLALASEPLIGPDGEAIAPGVLGERLARLEELETARQDEIAAEAADDLAKDLAKEERHLGRRDMFQSVILDPSRTEAEKAKAWRDLDQLDVEAWTDPVVLAMLEVANSADPEVREDVWKGADADHHNTLLVTPLLRSLASDPVAKVREEAADALSRYVDEPGVRTALERARDTDADVGVREQALESLGG